MAWAISGVRIVGRPGRRLVAGVSVAMVAMPLPLPGITVYPVAARCLFVITACASPVFRRAGNDDRGDGARERRAVCRESGSFNEVAGQSRGGESKAKARAGAGRGAGERSEVGTRRITRGAPCSRTG